MAGTPCNQLSILPHTYTLTYMCQVNLPVISNIAMSLHGIKLETTCLVTASSNNGFSVLHTCIPVGIHVEVPSVQQVVSEEGLVPAEVWVCPVAFKGCLEGEEEGGRGGGGGEGEGEGGGGRGENNRLSGVTYV